MKKGIFQCAAAWMMMLVLLAATVSTTVFSGEVKAAEGNENNEEPVYAGCLVNETDFQETVFWGDGSISEEDYAGNDPYIAADSLEDLFQSAGEKDNFQGYLLIWVDGKARTPEIAVTLPDVLGNIPVKGIAIMAYEEDAPLLVNRFVVNAPLAVRGVVDGNLELIYPEKVPTYGDEEAGTYFEGVLLLNAYIGGSVFACDENGADVTEAAGVVTMGESTHIGGLHGIERTVLTDELIVEGEGIIEFWNVETQGHYRELLIADYQEERLPVFYRNVKEDQTAFEYRMLLEDFNTYPVKEYQDNLFVQKDGDYYSVWWAEDFAVSGVSEDSKVTDETFIEELDTAFSEDTVQCYVVSEDEYPLYRYYYEDSETGENCEVAYIQKEDGILYPEDMEVYSQLEEEMRERIRNSALFPAAESGEALETVEEQYQHDGGICTMPNIAVRYIKPETLGAEREDVALAEGTKVIRYQCPGLMSAPEEFAYRNYSLEDESIDLITDVDGVVYDRNQLPAWYSLEAMSEEDFQNYGTEEEIETSFLKGDFASLENVLAGMKEDAKAGGSGYYKIFTDINTDSLLELEKIVVPEHVKGIVLETGWRDETTPGRILLDGAEFSNAGQKLRFCSLFVGGEEENTPSAKTFTVSGAVGSVVFSSCRLNQKIDGGNARITFQHDNFVKEYSGGQSTELINGVICVEDALDVTSGDGLKAENSLIAARADAKLTFGKISTLTGNQISGEEAGSAEAEGSMLDIISDTANGQPADIVLTSTDMEFGKGRMRLRPIDTNANPDCIFASSMYGTKSCLYADYAEGEEYIGDNNFDSDKNRLVYDKTAAARFATAGYSVYEELQGAENRTEAYESFFSKLEVEYKRSAEEGSEIFSVYNMGERLGELGREEPESPFSGKTAVIDGGDGLHYISYYYDYSGEQEDAPVLDENKYILLVDKASSADIPEDSNTPEPSDTPDTGTPEKEAPAHIHTPGEWAAEKEATGSEDGSLVQKCTGCGEILNRKSIPRFTVTLNVKSIPLQVKKSTTAVKAAVMEGDAVASWKSTNNKIATVTKSGKITGRKTGTAKIIVTTKKGATASVKVKVQKGIVKAKKVTADKRKLTLKVKKSYTLKIVLTPITTTEKVTYATSNKKVASVSRKGKITARKAGTAAITIKCGKKKATVKVTVKK